MASATSGASSKRAADAPADTEALRKEKKQPTGLERYTLGKILGEGGFASVRRAHDEVGMKEVAVKLMSKRRTNAAAAHRERDVLRSVGLHAHVVCLLDDFETPESFALVMELVTGGEVFDRVATKGAFSEADAATVMRSLARALQHLHGMGVVHRDLKPENLLLTAREDVKVADFGLATFCGPGHPPLRQLCGTVNYIAPEMVAMRASGIWGALGKAPAPYGVSVDLWSAGAILFTLLGAYCAFDPAANLPHARVEAAIKANRWSFDVFPQQWTHVSDAARGIIRKLLEPDVAKRLTAAALLEEPWVRGADAPTQPLPPSHREKLAAFQAGRRTWRAAADAAALFLGSPHTAHGVASAAGGDAPLPESAEEELRTAFRVYDKDGNGDIDLDELRDVVTALHVGGRGADALEVMSAADTNGDGRISFEEFKQLVRPLYDASASALRKIFAMFDADGSGFIDVAELGVVLNKLGLGKDADTHEALERVFAAADTDGNGKVDFAEFTSLFARAAASTTSLPATAPSSATEARAT